MEIAQKSWHLKAGLLIVALAYFSFAFYEFTLSIFGRGTFWPTVVTDVPSVVGLAFRTAAGLIASVTVLFFIVKRDLERSEALMSLRWILLLEAAYWLSLLPSGLLGLTSGYSSSVEGFVESTLPCLIESIGLPILLAKLFFELNPKKPSQGKIKWSLILGTYYLFVFWLSNSGNWIYVVSTKGIGYVTSYTTNLFSFVLTTVGLLLLTIYLGYFSRKTSGNATIDLGLKGVGGILTALGLYFNTIYMLYIFFGATGGWSEWYAWFFNHNMDLWLVSLPLIGLPLLFTKETNELP
jgi:hypothetical protein